MSGAILLKAASVLCLLAGAAALSLSDYVTPCKSKDPQLNECVRKAAQQIIAKSGTGIPELDVPPLDPAKVSKLELARNGALTMNLVFKNSTHYGLGGVQVKSASVDPHRHVYNFSVVIPKYIVAGEYDVNGRVILLPITGHGHANITFTEVESEWSFSGEQETRDGGVAHLKLTNLVTRIHNDSPKKVELHFDGLFGGNKVLGDTMNDFMNQNWRELTKQLKPSVQASFDHRLLPVAQRFVSKFPLKELFVDL